MLIQWQVAGNLTDMSHSISLVSLTSARFAVMQSLDKAYCSGVLTAKDKDGAILPLTIDEIIQRLRSEEGRMASKGANISTTARGGKYGQSWSLAKGDTSPLWRLYWLSGEVITLRSELTDK